MPCFYLTPEQDDFNKIPELQVCIAEALYDVESPTNHLMRNRWVNPSLLAWRLLRLALWLRLGRDGYGIR